jgi:aminobenzoyl-glutamate utilization protein B
MAGSVIDLLTHPELLQKAKETFAQEVAGSNYVPLLPPDKKPPVDMNADEMAKYREAMKAHYPNAPIHFK